MVIVVRVYFVYASHLVLKVQNHSQALFAQKLRKFSANPLVKFFYILANLDSTSKVGHQPQTSDMGIWDFSKFGRSIKGWLPTPTPSHPPTLDMGIWDFSKFGLSIKSWPPTCPPLPPTCPPTLDMGNWHFSKFGLSIKSWPATPPPLTPLHPPTHPGHGN